MSIRRAAISAVAITAAAVAAPHAARADSVNMVFNQTGKGSSVQVSFFGQTPKNVYAGQLLHTITTATGMMTPPVGQHRSFCADFAQGVATTNSVFDVVATQDLHVQGTPMGLATAAAIENIFADYGGTATASSASNDFAAAFQIAVWDILYDFNNGQTGNGLGLTTGNIRFTATNGSAISSGILNAYNQIISAIGASASSGHVYALENSSRQDQLVYSASPIPTPGAAALAFAGFVVLTRRRRA